MKVKDTTGKEHSWNFLGHTVNFDRKCSEPHAKARDILKELYPTDTICEEVPLPGEKLFGDLYLPLRKLMVEVHGEQHYKYVSHFHGSIKGFLDSKARDKRKQEWCDINGIKLVVLPYNEEDKWKTMIINR